MGVSPREVSWMTPRQANLAIEGHHMQERRDWQKFLRVSAFLGDEASVNDLFKVPSQPAGMDEGKWAQLKERMGYGAEAKSIEERERDALDQEARYIEDLHGSTETTDSSQDESQVP